MSRNEDYYDDDDHHGAYADDEGYDDDVLRSGATGDDVARTTAASDDEMVYADGREGDDSWLGMGLAAVLLVSGALLFLFPEPATSMLGIGLIVAGLVVWVASAIR